jgi:3-oxoacyl-[acyl-carrier-protein] synthase-1
LRRCAFAPAELAPFGRVHTIDTYIGEVDGVDAVALPPQLARFDCRNNRLAYLGLQQDGFTERIAELAARHGAHRVALILGTSTSGLFYAASAPVVASLPAQVLRPETRGPGFGIYYIWYFAGSAFLPVVGGYLKDITGTAASSVLFGVAMMIATLTLAGLFRLTQACIPVRAGSRG